VNKRIENGLWTNKEDLELHQASVESQLRLLSDITDPTTDQQLDVERFTRELKAAKDALNDLERDIPAVQAA
jgi:hypothetical protein